MVVMDDTQPQRAGVDGERIERLIRAIDAQTNMLARVVGLFETKARTKAQPSARLRRVPADRPIKVTPIVQAAVKRALARIQR